MRASSVRLKTVDPPKGNGLGKNKKNCPVIGLLPLGEQLDSFVHSLCVVGCQLTYLVGVFLVPLCDNADKHY